MKIRQVLRLRHHAGELAQRLRHQPRLQAHVAVAHLAVQFGLGNQRRHRIHHQHVDRSRGDQRAGDLERLLAVIGLRNQQVVDIHAQLFGVGRIERVFHVDERRHAALLLRFGDHLQGDGGLAGRFRAEDLDDAAARKAAHAQSGVQRDGTRRDHRPPERWRPSSPGAGSSPFRTASQSGSRPALRRANARVHPCGSALLECGMAKFHCTSGGCGRCVSERFCGGCALWRRLRVRPRSPRIALPSEFAVL